MLNPQTMTSEQETEVRDKAFYLLKKYTSYTFLGHARDLYQGFLDAFAKELNKSRKNIESYEEKYKLYLKAMIPLEEGVSLLKAKLLWMNCKPEAFKAFKEASNAMGEVLVGRAADEWGVCAENDFFAALGARGEFYIGEDGYENETGVIKDALLALRILGCALFTSAQNSNGIPEKFWVHIGDKKTSEQYWAERWSYSWIFEKEFPIENIDWPLPQYFPKIINSCPSKNTDSDKQIWSDTEIKTTGIYEPWTLDNKVGCPNYFLAGQTALKYPIEGKNELEKVRWRLIWEDKRYLDGSIPKEEEEYLKEPVAINSAANSTISANPGTVCEKSGMWSTTAMLDVRSIQIKAGENFPAATQDKSGNGVIWYWKSN